jgi:hypothetical protein
MPDRAASPRACVYASAAGHSRLLHYYYIYSSTADFPPVSCPLCPTRVAAASTTASPPLFMPCPPRLLFLCALPFTVFYPALALMTVNHAPVSSSSSSRVCSYDAREHIPPSLCAAAILLWVTTFLMFLIRFLFSKFLLLLLRARTNSPLILPLSVSARVPRLAAEDNNRNNNDDPLLRRNIELLHWHLLARKVSAFYYMRKAALQESLARRKHRSVEPTFVRDDMPKSSRTLSPPYHRRPKR